MISIPTLFLTLNHTGKGLPVSRVCSFEHPLSSRSPPLRRRRPPPPPPFPPLPPSLFFLASSRTLFLKPPMVRVCTLVPRETSTYTPADSTLARLFTLPLIPIRLPLNVSQERPGTPALSGRLLGQPLPPSQQRMDPCQPSARGARGEMQGKIDIPILTLLILPSPRSLCSSLPLAFQSSSSRASLLALTALLDLLHLPVLRHHRQHLAPACLERLLHLAPLLREPSQEEEVSLHARTKRKHDALLAFSTFYFSSSSFFRRWPWPSSRSSGCLFPFMRPRWPASSRLVHGFPPLHLSLHSRKRSLTLSLSLFRSISFSLHCSFPPMTGCGVPRRAGSPCQFGGRSGVALPAGRTATWQDAGKGGKGSRK